MSKHKRNLQLVSGGLKFGGKGGKMPKEGAPKGGGSNTFRNTIIGGAAANGVAQSWWDKTHNIQKPAPLDESGTTFVPPQAAPGGAAPAGGAPPAGGGGKGGGYSLPPPTPM
jgi:hypothetical protein